MRQTWIVPLAIGLVACQSDAPKLVEITLIEVRGDVTGGSDHRPLKTGDRLTIADGIKVGDGRAVIEMPDGTLIKLYSKTRLTAPGERRVNLTLGRIWLAVTKAVGGKQFEVETPNAVAGVRGTEFVVDAMASRTRVAVVTGTVEVVSRRALKHVRRVTRGQQVIIEGNRAAGEPKPFESTEHIEAWESLGKKHPESGPAVQPEPATSPRGETDVPPEMPAKAAATPRREKSALEREGEATKRRLQKESAATKKRLERQEERTRRDLADEEKKIREDMERDREKAKGDVKDFLK